MKIEFKEGFVLPPLVGNRQYGERAMAALLAEVESQVAKGIIEQCSDAPVVAVVMVNPQITSQIYLLLRASSGNGPIKSIEISSNREYCLSEVLQTI